VQVRGLGDRIGNRKSFARSNFRGFSARESFRFQSVRKTIPADAIYNGALPRIGLFPVIEDTSVAPKPPSAKWICPQTSLRLQSATCLTAQTVQRRRCAGYPFNFSKDSKAKLLPGLVEKELSMEPEFRLVIF
jgi:hypothetical protein